MRLGAWDMVVCSDYEMAKELLAREEWADRPQYPALHFFMKYKETGK
jgi:hypothetical protein